MTGVNVYGYILGYKQAFSLNGNSWYTNFQIHSVISLVAQALYANVVDSKISFNGSFQCINLSAEEANTPIFELEGTSFMLNGAVWDLGARGNGSRHSIIALMKGDRPYVHVGGWCAASLGVDRTLGHFDGSFRIVEEYGEFQYYRFFLDNYK